MKQKCIFFGLAFVLALTACEEYDSLPEPELPVEDVIFTGAWYNPPPDHSISLSFDVPFSFDKVYRYYNKNDTFSIVPYLKNNTGRGIVSTELMYFSKGFELKLSEDGDVPAILEFNTQEPLYFDYWGSVWWASSVIVGKGFIKTPNLTVSGLP